MSEIGPIRVRSRFFCRMISCPAANGIICSSWRPSATLAASGTSSAIASRMASSLAMALLALPLRLALVQESFDAFLRILRLDELFQINLFSARQSFIKVHRIPSVDCLLGNRERRRTQLDELTGGFLDRPQQSIVRYRSIDQANCRRFGSRNRSPGQDQIGSLFLSHYSR